MHGNELRIIIIVWHRLLHYTDLVIVQGYFSRLLTQTALKVNFEVHSLNFRDDCERLDKLKGLLNGPLNPLLNDPLTHC